MNGRSLEFLIPGDLDCATGGYGYDRKIIAGLRELGWRVNVRALDATFPHPSPAALAHAHRTLEQLADGALVLIDGLAAGAMPKMLHAHATRLRLVGLVHHPLDREGGLDADQAKMLADSERQSLQAMRHVVVTSNATRRTLADYAADLARVSVVEPGTDPAPVSRSEYAGPLRLLCVATVTARKGHDVLAAALAPFKDKAWRLTCVGSLDRSPESVRQLRQQLAQSGLDSRVTLTGEVDEATLARCYQEADLFVMPTRYEGYGMAVAEALAHGLPVIGSSVGAIPELVGAGAGLLVAPGDVNALSSALSRVLRQPQLLARFAAGAARVRNRLPSWASASASMASVLELQDSVDPGVV
jgi:glycosyltransferase involved in cell wall biosynthesis